MSNYTASPAPVFPSAALRTSHVDGKHLVFLDGDYVGVFYRIGTATGGLGYNYRLMVIVDGAIVTEQQWGKKAAVARLESLYNARYDASASVA